MDPAAAEQQQPPTEAAAEEEEAGSASCYYDKTKSFFDNLSCDDLRYGYVASSFINNTVECTKTPILNAGRFG